MDRSLIASVLVGQACEPGEQSRTHLHNEGGDGGEGGGEGGGDGGGECGGDILPNTPEICRQRSNMPCARKLPIAAPGGGRGKVWQAEQAREKVIWSISVRDVTCRAHVRAD